MLNLRFNLIIACCIGAWALPPTSAGEVRIKDITQVHGERINQLIGLGLVTGLAGTGGKSPITRQFALNFEQRMGIRSDPASRTRLDNNQARKTDNLSVVMITAELPAFAKNGSEIDVIVSAYDDAKSLQGGVLIRTPLYGVDGEVYAVAAGPVSIGGFSFSGQGGSVKQNHPTTGRIALGATVEQETCTPIGNDGYIRLLLRNPDFETARRITETLNLIAPSSSRVLDPGTVECMIPSDYLGRTSDWVARIGNLTIEPDLKARVVINERTGTVIIGEGVRLSRVLITHANLTVTTVESPQVSQPAPFSNGETTVVPRTDITVSEDGFPVSEIHPNVTVGDLASALNALGVSPRDLSSIFQQLKESGALHAELEMK
ncbi:MAG: flagellar basal body P-ring protein FlgI [Planctomycetaceae bacterium]